MKGSLNLMAIGHDSRKGRHTVSYWSKPSRLRSTRPVCKRVLLFSVLLATCLCVRSGWTLSVVQVPGSAPSGVIEIAGLSAGQFTPSLWTANTLNWVSDVRVPLIAPLAGTWRNIYAPNVVQEPSDWRLFYGGWDGSSTANDRVWSYTTQDFITFTNHALVIDHGYYTHVNNVNVQKIEDGSYQMVCTAYPDRSGLNKPAYFSSPDGIIWNGKPQPYAARLSDLITVAGYPNYAQGNFNGGNVLLRDNGSYKLYLYNFNYAYEVAWCSGSSPTNCTYQGVALNPSYVVNDVKMFTVGGTNWYVMGLHFNTASVFYALSTNGTNYNSEQILFQHPYGTNDQYMVSVGFAWQGNSLLGAIYGAGPVSALNENQLFARWLQKRLVLTNSSGVVPALGGLGPDRQQFKPASSPFQGTLTAYAEDGTTVLGSVSVNLTAGNVYQVLFTNAPPPAPTGLGATPSDGQICLTWNASADATTSYNVKRSTTSGGPYATIAPGLTATSYTDTNAANGTTYYYVVSAVNAVGESANSWEASATPSLLASCKLVFTTQPTGTNAGQVIAPAVVVQIQTTAGNNIGSNNVPITLTLNGGGNLTGTATQNTDISGKATFGDLSVTNAGSKTLTAAAPGIGSGLANATSISFTITPPAAVAGFTAGPTNGVAPLTVIFTNLSIGATNYAWAFGDGNGSALANPTNTYTDAGTYSVTLTAVGPGGTDQLTMTNYIVVVPPPLVVVFTAGPTNGVAPLTVIFTNLSTGATNYAWAFGDGNVSALANPINTYTNSGTYSVTLTGIGPTGTNQLTMTNLILAVPAVVALGQPRSWKGRSPAVTALFWLLLHQPSPGPPRPTPPGCIWARRTRAARAAQM